MVIRVEVSFYEMNVSQCSVLLSDGNCVCVCACVNMCMCVFLAAPVCCQDVAASCATSCFVSSHLIGQFYSCYSSWVVLKHVFLFDLRFKWVTNI